MSFRQRALFSAPSAPKAPGQKRGWSREHKLQAATAEYMHYAVSGVAFWTGIDAANKEAFERIMRAERGIRSGVPDFIVLWRAPDGMPLFLGIEMKTESGRMSSDQLGIRDEIIRLGGGLHYVCTDSFQVEAVLREHGIPVRGRHMWLEPAPKVRAASPKKSGPTRVAAAPARRDHQAMTRDGGMLEKTEAPRKRRKVTTP